MVNWINLTQILWARKRCQLFNLNRM